MNKKHLSFITLSAFFLFMISCDESTETAETQETHETTIREQPVEVEPEPEEEVYTIEDDPFELEREEIINEIRASYNELEEKINAAESHISSLDANRQEAYAGNIQWLNTTMRYISDRKATLHRVEQDGFDNVKADIEEQLYQVEEHLMQLESAIY